MFSKKECKKCGKKIGKKYRFCPYCGSETPYGNEGDWGMLGKDDELSGIEEIRLPAGFNSLFNSLIKNLSREMDTELRSNFRGNNNQKKIKKDGLSISISTFGAGAPKIRVNPLENKKTEQTTKPKKFKPLAFSKEQVKKFSSLKKEEMKTSIRRLSDEVIYELEMPGVKSKEDISIIPMENSIEIKAISKNKAYVKRIPINLPVKNYDFSDGRLILGLGVKN